MDQCAFLLLASDDADAKSACDREGISISSSDYFSVLHHELFVHQQWSRRFRRQLGGDYHLRVLSVSLVLSFYLYVYDCILLVRSFLLLLRLFHSSVISCSLKKRN